MIAEYAIMYPMMVDGCWPFRVKATVTKARAVMASAKAVISSSEDLRVTDASSGWLPRAGDGMVMLLTRPPRSRASWPWPSGWESPRA